METTVKEIGKNKVLLEVEISTDDVDKAIDRAYQIIAHEIKIDGFRKGKVPSSVIDGKVGAQAVLERAVREALPVFYLKAVEASGIKPISQPKVNVDVAKFNKGESFSFSCEVEVEPEVKLAKHKGIKVKKEKTEVNTEEVNLHIEILRDKFARLESVNRPIKEKDFTLISFEGSIDGKSFEGGSAEDFLLEVGSQRFVPGFEEQLISLGSGEIRDVKVKFPLDYAFPELVGKDATFRVLVKEVKEKVLPQLTDEFATEVGGFNNLEELREDIMEKLKEAKEVKVESKAKADIIKKLVDEVKVEIPSVMIDNEVAEMIEEFAYNLHQRGFSLQDYLKATKATFEEVKQSLREDAVARVKQRLVLAAVAEEEGIKVTKEDIEREIDSYAKIVNKSPDELKKSINTGLLEEDLKLRKAFDWVIENAIIEEEKGKGKGKVK